MICNTFLLDFYNFSHILFPETVDFDKKRLVFCHYFAEKIFLLLTFYFPSAILLMNTSVLTSLKKGLSKRKNADAFQV